MMRFATVIDVSSDGSMVLVVGRKVPDDGMHADLSLGLLDLIT